MNISSDYKTSPGIPTALDMLPTHLHYLNVVPKGKTLTGTAFHRKPTTMSNPIFRLFFYMILIRAKDLPDKSGIFKSITGI